MTYLPTSALGLVLGALAADTWENLCEANKLSVRYGEETITDTMMLYLRRRGFTVFRQTTLHQEAKYGTDFECWIGSDNVGWIGYAVQAKKLDIGNGRYRNLDRVVKSTQRRQIDILETYAKYRRMTPRYCLYSYSSNVSQNLLSCCSRSFSEKDLGCTLTPVWVVERAIGTYGGKTFNCLQQHHETVPWRCLALCPRLQRSLSSGQICPTDVSPLLDVDSTIHRRLPHDLRSLLETSPSKVDFEEFGIGVDSRTMDYDRQELPRFLIPKRVYILNVCRLQYTFVDTLRSA